MLKQAHHLLFGVEGSFVRKGDVENYINRVKQSNPNGVVLCIDTEDGTHEKIKTQGAFNVYFQIGKKIYIDYLGKGFDMGAITKGKENHESWVFDWGEAIFVKPKDMNEYGYTKISDEDYLESARRRLRHLLNIGYSPDEIRGKIPKTYTPMPMWIKDMLLEEIVMPLYYKEEVLKQEGLKSFGVQGMIIKDKLFPIEVNREQRFAEKRFLEKSQDEER